MGSKGRIAKAKPPWLINQTRALQSQHPRGRNRPISEYEASLVYKVYCRPHGRKAPERESVSKRNHHPPSSWGVALTFDLHTSKKEVMTVWDIPPNASLGGELPAKYPHPPPPPEGLGVWDKHLSTLSPACDENLEPGTGETERL